MKRLWFFEVCTDDYYLVSKLYPTKKACVEAADDFNGEYTIGSVFDD